MLYRMLRFFATSMVMTAVPATLAEETVAAAGANPAVESGMASVYASDLEGRAAAELGPHPNGQRRVEITVEALGDGKRQPSPAGSTPRLLPERIEATANDTPGRARVCANEADILGLKGALWESHVRNCLGRKSRPPAATAEAKALPD